MRPQCPDSELTGPESGFVDERQRDAVPLDLVPIALCAAARASGQTGLPSRTVGEMPAIQYQSRIHRIHH